MDELVEILNEDGKKVGDTISKFKAHQEGICHGISAIALIDDKGRLSIQRRCASKKDEPNNNGIQLNHFTYLFIVKKNINNEKVVVEKREVSETKFVNKEELIRMLENDEMVSAMGHCSKVLDYMK